MKKIINYILIFVFLVGISSFTTGCTSDMDGINIIVTNYPNEYIVNRLYGEHSTISSIYPDGVDPTTYKVTKKQKNEFAKSDLFIYNGLVDSERNLAIDLLDINPSLKIIDSAYILDSEYSAEELWLNPASLLMMSENVKNGLDEYISSTYLQKEINENYDALQIDLSLLDVEYRDSVTEASNNTVVVDDASLKFLERFGLTVYCLDSSSTDKTIAIVEDLIEEEKIKYIITFSDTDLNSVAKDVMDKHSSVKELELHRLSNLTDAERDNSEDYLTIMEHNLQQLNQELYH